MALKLDRRLFPPISRLREFVRSYDIIRLLCDMNSPLPRPLAGCMWISASTTGYREEVVHFTRKGRNVLFVWMFADVNECRSENGGCEQICENTDGSFRCSCRSGYTLNFDQRSCDSKYTCKGYRRYMETPKDCITGLSWEESTDPR